MANPEVIIIGAGPAGLTAGYVLSQQGKRVVVFEADSTYVGGISRSERYKGYTFDIGGHRFFSKSKRIEALWKEILPDDLITRPRLSRILYKNNFYNYPLRPLDALLKLGPIESLRCMLSYGKVKLFPLVAPRTFEQWVTNKFGHRLYSIFFKTYTEKVWGMKCSEISSDWAAQRIRGLSLSKAIINGLIPQALRAGGNRTKIIKTLIDTFMYPRRGPGMLWEAAAAKIKSFGGELRLGYVVTNLEFLGKEKGWRVHYKTAEGTTSFLEAPQVISSAPLRDIASNITPPLKNKLSAEKLRYRDFIVVALIGHDKNVFNDNWLYIHDPNVKVGRIQNYKAWSPDLVPDLSMNCYGMEYFCFEGDGLWSKSDKELIALAREEFVKLGLGNADDIVDGTVVRQPKAYPVYDDSYSDHVVLLRDELEANYPGLHLVGRNGMHMYNNQDHSMMTALLTAENIIAGKKNWDVWSVNQDAEYHEERIDETAQNAVLKRSVPRALIQ